MKEMSNNKRLQWLDVLKGICALLVILVHTKKPEAYAFLFRPFFLMCFFFASGYTEKPKGKYIRKEIVRTLGILTTVEIVRIVYTGIVQHQFVGWGQIFSAYFQDYVQYPTYTPIIWFVPCTCLAKIIFQVTLRFSNGKIERVVLLSLVLGIMGLLYCKYIAYFLPWHLHTAFLAQLFFATGYTYRYYEKRIEPFEAVILGISALLYFCIICRGPFAADLALLKVLDWSRYMSTAFLGTIMMVLVSKRFITSGITRTLQFVGKNSLFFFAFQGYFINYTNKMMDKILVSSESKYISCLLVTMISAICLASLCGLRDFVYRVINEKLGKQLKPIV